MIPNTASLCLDVLLATILVTIINDIIRWNNDVTMNINSNPINFLLLPPGLYKQHDTANNDNSVDERSWISYEPVGTKKEEKEKEKEKEKEEEKEEEKVEKVRYPINQAHVKSSCIHVYIIFFYY